MGKTILIYSSLSLIPLNHFKTYLLEIQDGRHCRQGFSIHVAPYGNMKKKNWKR
jgi:hypothetical protein